MRIPTAFLALATAFAVVPTAGCGPSSPPAVRESCWLCNGTGRVSSGRACDSCLGKGYQEVPKYELARRHEAEENLRRKEAGLPPLPPPGWWENIGGWKGVGLIGFLVCSAIGVGRSRGK